jgi:hypothetical protein
MSFQCVQSIVVLSSMYCSIRLHYKDCFNVWWFFLISLWATPKHEEILVYFLISVLSMSKKTDQTLGRENHTFVLGKSK